MLKKIAVFMLVFTLCAPAHAVSEAENTALLREYARVATEINEQLEYMKFLFEDNKERERILLSPKKRGEFCTKVGKIFSNMSRKMRLLEPGALKTSDAFPDNAAMATEEQVTKLKYLTEAYPSLFKLCEASVPKMSRPAPTAPAQ